ncbi:MAG: hypothetical protein HYX92_13850 [Chloroflexi bacterium]|nr:hypothetical protein [Chloroflexota bacterium]
MGKLNCVLLDANIVIETHELGIWEELLDSVTVTLPSVVIDREARYFFDPLAGASGIALRRLLAEGRLHVIEATGGELLDLSNQFDRVFIERIDEGEAEALSVLMAGRLPGYLFCTADAPAIRALALLDMAERGTSLQRLLSSVGLTKRVEAQYTDEFFKRVLEEGQRMRLQGIGLAPGSRYRV